MACSKVMHGNCSRCGKVGPAHFKKPGLADCEDSERKQILDAFFQAKARRKGFPTKAQLAKMRRLC